MTSKFFLNLACCLLVTLTCSVNSNALERTKEAPKHPVLLLTDDQVEHFRHRVAVNGSLNKNYFDRIKRCSDHVPSPLPGWDPPMADFMQSPHASVLSNVRKRLIKASHSAMKYAIDREAFEVHGSAATACACDVVDKWNPAEIINQYRDKIDGSGDEHEGAQFVIYMALVYDMAYDKFSESQRQQVIDWLALAGRTAGESESTYYPSFEPYPRQNHPACMLVACGFAAITLKDEMDRIGDPGLRNYLQRQLRETNENLPRYILDRVALADGRAWEGSAYGTYTLPFAMLWGRAYNNAYQTNVFAGKGITNIIRWYAHSKAAFGPHQLVEYGDDYDRYGGFSEMLILFEQANADGHDLWLLDYLHPGADIFVGPHKTQQAYTDAFLTYPLFFPQDIKPIAPTVAGQRPTQYFRDFRDKSGGEVHFKNQFIETKEGDDTVQMVLYSHRDEISKGGLAQGSIRLYAYGEKFTEEEGRSYKDRAWWGTMKHFTTFDYFDADCGHDGSLPKHEFYAQRKNPGLGRVGGFLASDFADYARADGRFPLGDPSRTAAPHPNNERYRLACSPTDDPSKPTYCEPVNKADRMVMMLKSPQRPSGTASARDVAKPLFIVVDDYDIDGDAQRYRWRWHAPRRPIRKNPKSRVDPTANDFVIDGQGTQDWPFRVFDPNVDRTKLEITFVAPNQFQSDVSQFAPSGGVNHALLEVTKTDVNPLFFSIVYPRKSGFDRPVIQTLESTATGIAGCEIRWSDQLIDRVIGGRGGSVDLGGLSTDSRIAVTRQIDGNIVAYAVAEGSYLQSGATPLVSGISGAGSLSMSGEELVVSEGIRSGRFYGPDVSVVSVNDRKTAFSRDGVYVEFDTKAKDKGENQP